MVSSVTTHDVEFVVEIETVAFIAFIVSYLQNVEFTGY
jgi:hypothetical protein